MTLVSSVAARDGLIRDRCFWFALALGPAGAWLVSSVMRHPATLGADLWDPSRLTWFIVLYPMAEEWLFRGLIQRGLYASVTGKRQKWGLSAANGITTALFVSAHLITLDMNLALLVAAPSLLFGWFRDRYGSILPGFVLHSSYNLFYFAMALGC